MYKVLLKNVEKNLEWSATFESLDSAQEWLSSQIGKPHRLPEREVSTGEKDENDQPIMQLLPAEFTSEIIDISAQVALDLQKSEARKFLADTDWLIIREMDSGVACPADIKLQRQASREIL